MAYVEHSSVAGRRPSLIASLRLAVACLLVVTGAGRATATPPFDMNGDGYEDTIEVTPGYNAGTPQTGLVRVKSGFNQSVLHDLIGSVPNDYFGFAVLPAGDLVVDGSHELFVAATRAGFGTNSVGRVYAFSGMTGAALFQASGPPGVWIGLDLAMVEDQDDDGIDDLLVAGGRLLELGLEPWTVLFSGASGRRLTAVPRPIEDLVAAAAEGHPLYFPEDADGNGVVDLVDINLVFEAYHSGNLEVGDVNRNGVLDILDLQQVLAAGGTSLELTSQGSGAETLDAWNQSYQECQAPIIIGTFCSGFGHGDGGLNCSVVIQNCPSPDNPVALGGYGQLVAVGSPAGGTYSWERVGGTAQISIIGGTDGPLLRFTGVSTGWARYRVTYTVNGCTACDECTVHVGAACGVGMWLDDWNVFLWSRVVRAQGWPEGGSYEFYIVSGAGLVAGMYPQGPNAVRIVPTGQAGMVTVGVTYTAPNGCVATAEIFFFVGAQPMDVDGDGLANANDPCPFSVDCDSDGYNDPCEVKLGSNPQNPQSVPDPGLDGDLDGLPDVQEFCLGCRAPGPIPPGGPIIYFSDYKRFDCDGDGIQDLAEIELGLNPFEPDPPSVFAPYDLDQDWIYDEYEREMGWDSTDPDMDGNGVADGVQLASFGINPALGGSLGFQGGSPLGGSGQAYLNMAMQYTNHMLATYCYSGAPDNDGDGLCNSLEAFLGTNQNYFDTDHDGLSDLVEMQLGLNALNSDTDGDGTWDYNEDADGDGLINHEELIYGTDAGDWDTDDDGVGDGVEIERGSNPRDPSDGGIPPPEDDLATVWLRVGDHSGSHSELWALEVGSIRLFAPGFGQVTDLRPFKFKRGTMYEIRLIHLGSILNPIQPDWTAEVSVASADGWVHDPQDLLGVHMEIDECGCEYCGCNAAAGRVAYLYLPQVDVDIDSDNTNDFDAPDRNANEEELENDTPSDTNPGKVILVDSLDSDRDGIPDFADGMDWMATPSDDVSSGAFVPVAVSFGGPPELEEVTIDIQYSASDPSPGLVTEDLNNPYILPAGQWRLWKVNAGQSRDPRSVRDGGHYIPPGSYTPDELGWTTQPLTVTWYLEALRPSATAGNGTLQVTAEFVHEGQTRIISDTVRATATEVRVEGRAFGSNTLFEPVAGFIGTLLDDPAEPPTPQGFTPAAWMTYRITVMDPRQSGVNQLSLNGHTLSLQPSGGGYQTSEFIWIPSSSLSAGAVPPVNPYLAIGAAVSEVEGEYNPSWVQPGAAQSKAPTKWDKEMVKALVDVQGEMETQGWAGQGYAPNDSGAYGKEVHARMKTRLTGSRWLHDLWIEKGTNRVLQIGGTAGPPGVPAANVQQVDIMYAKQGYQPTVGQILDHNQIEDLYDVKTTVSNELDPGQKASLKAVIGGRDVKVAQTPRRWTQAQGWQDIPNSHRRNRMKILGMVGVVSAAMAMVSHAEETEHFRAEIDPLIREARNTTDFFERKAIAIELHQKLTEYFGRFMPDSTALDIASLIALYRKLGESE